MPTKTTGAELKRFHDDDEFWGEGTNWHEDLTLKVNGVEKDEDFNIADLQDSDQVTILSGWIHSEKDDGPDCSFETFFKRWRKNQNTAYLGVSFPKDKLEAIKAAIKAAGGTIHA